MTMTKSLEQVSRGQKWTKTDSKTRRVSHYSGTYGSQQGIAKSGPLHIDRKQLMSPTIESLGECRLLSPLRPIGSGAGKFKVDSERILCDDRSNDKLKSGVSLSQPLTFEVAGPRERIFFDPAKTTAAVVTLRWPLSRSERCYPGHRDGALA